MSRIEEINTLSEQILNQQALTDTKQLGLQACTIAAQLATENERLTAERDKWKACAKAFEKATEVFETSSVFSFACFCCVFKDTTNAHICTLWCDDTCTNMSDWRFDVERFSGKARKPQ